MPHPDQSDSSRLRYFGTIGIHKASLIAESNQWQPFLRRSFSDPSDDQL